MYEGLCRALLEKDKLIFSLLMCLKIMISDNKISNQELRFTMVGGVSTETSIPKPDDEWISKKMWCLISEATDELPAFTNWATNFKPAEWKHIFDSSSPQSE